MFKPNVGRKQESGVWDYFEYEPSVDKSKCKASNCTTCIKGKNATNLMNHLVSKHKELAAAVEKRDKDRKKTETTSQTLLKVNVTKTLHLIITHINFE
jgi:carbonic anhydrase